ncbi:hypothetical protein LKO27_09570 [Tessaracoccus sp. OS52]|uniref:hypothetical protein n=1 Tax=Tessaracoccus sp. OS52 TaxID=2886691 RepID=UPI001D12573C|nr:hypothetical protein [Tessaracoccus sp. OS52]MCC2593651.1 hypothetical protein [Tessaracoccus sp. OS52]
MSASPADRLLAECAHLRPVDEPALDALRRAVLVEDVLGVRVVDEQIRMEFLTDPDALRALPADPTTLV